MTHAVASGWMLVGARSREQARLTWPLLTILCLQAGLFVWMAPRGLDFTDESYYLLSYLHWREFTATATFFGAYFDGPFRLMNQHVAWIRIFGMALLVAAGGFFSWRAMTFASASANVGKERGFGVLPFAVAGTASTFFYYSYGTTLRVPSYNLLVLFCMLTATGLLLYLVEGRGSRQARCVAALGYGLLLGACALGKATSAVAMLVCHGVFFATFDRRRHHLELIGLALVGVAVNFVALQLLQPRWIQVLREGVALTIALDGRYAAVPLAALWNAVLRGGIRLLPALLVATLAYGFVVRRWGHRNRAAMSCTSVLLVAGIMLTIQFQGYGKSWWALLVFGSGLLWWAESICGRSVAPVQEIRSSWGLSILLFALPVAFSIGTNGSLPAHTEMAAVFGVVALMLPLQRLSAMRYIHPGALIAALVMCCMPTVVFQWRSLQDLSFTYRLRAALVQQQSLLTLGAAGDTLLVDAATRDDVVALAKTMHDAGFRVGEPILDVTGDGPGLVYALGGRPVGVGWLLGGYPGSEAVAAQVFQSVPAQLLRQAWVLSADENPRAIHHWAQHLSERIGSESHTLAGSILYRAQYSQSAQGVTLKLWKPAESPPIRSPHEAP